MPLPKGPNPGGLPQRPGSGLPMPGTGGLPEPLPRPQDQLPKPDAFTPPKEEPNYRSGMDRLSEYDFGAREVDLEDLERGNDEPDEDYSLEDILGSNEDEKARIEELSSRRDRETAERFDRSMEKKAPSKKPKNNVLKPQAGELDDKGQNVFIDKKNKKLEPFGGKKSALKVNDLDKRKNMRQNATIVKVVVISLCVLTLGFAVKNAFAPPMGLSESEVQNIIYNTTGTSAFPLQQGGFFAESFMEAYLEYDPAAPDDNSIIQYYTTGALGSGGAVVPGTTYGKNFKQTIVNGPIVYNSQAASPNSAIYTVGALVRVENTVAGSNEVPANGSGSTDTGEAPVQADAASGSLAWKFFAINVYYDEEARAFGIASAPTVTAVPEALKSNDVPGAAPIGSGQTASNDVVTSVTPTIYGFLSAYRESSPTSYDQLLPFLGSDPDQMLLTGLDSTYQFKGGRANEQSVSITAYTTDTSLIKAVLTVTWVQNVGGSFIETQSSYVMDIQPISGGYDVTRFLPLAYVPNI